MKNPQAREAVPIQEAERVIGLYEKTAREFDRARTKSLFERPWLDRFLAMLPKTPSVLDLGCGTGEPIGRYLAESGATLTGVDPAPAMIVQCKARLPAQEWLIGDMRDLDLGRTFDGVIAWHSMIHLTPDDQRSIIPRLARHVAPAGALMFTSGPEHGELIGQWAGEPLYSGSLDPAEYRDLLETAGFTIVDYRLDDPDCGGATIWLASLRVPE